jgi:thiosulfate dehydrogenase
VNNTDAKIRRNFLLLTLQVVVIGTLMPHLAHADEPPAGHAIATQGTTNGVAACIGCHGANGEGNAAAGFPRLAALSAPYLVAQLTAFADGTRPDPVMQPLAARLSAPERDAVAAYFAALPAPSSAKLPNPQPAEPSDVGAWLATRGNWNQDLPACTQCHGPGGAGVGATFPPLTGQPAAYIAKQLRDWRAGTRPPGPMGLMNAVANKLGDADGVAVANYYAGVRAPVDAAAPAAASDSATKEAPLTSPSFAPPPASSLPHDDFGRTVKEGEQIFMSTQTYAGKYVGNSLTCANCHLDAGRKADAGPLWGAWPLYPAFRSKNGHVNSFAERLQGCFSYSMNGKAPPLGDPVLVALETYAYWLAKGAPVGVRLPGQGYPKLPAPAQKADYARGQALYAQHCALCHGANGQGQSSAGQTAFPPLWGTHSFNWGAGMGDIQNAAGFIKANMPLGLGGTLTEQQAWDVALFMDSQERPQDPRYVGSVDATRAKFHDSPYSMYGKTVEGKVLGAPGAQ